MYLVKKVSSYSYIYLDYNVKKNLLSDSPKQLSALAVLSP